jgi:hypothetical protein
LGLFSPLMRLSTMNKSGIPIFKTLTLLFLLLVWVEGKADTLSILGNAAAIPSKQLSLRQVFDSLGLEIYRDSMHYNELNQRVMVSRWRGISLIKSWNLRYDSLSRVNGISETTKDHPEKKVSCEYDLGGSLNSWTQMVGGEVREKVADQDLREKGSQKEWSTDKIVTQVQFNQEGLPQSLEFGAPSKTPNI